MPLPWSRAARKLSMPSTRTSAIFCAARQPAKAHELAEQPPQVAVVRGGEARDLGARSTRSPNTRSQVGHHDRAAQRQEARDEAAGARRLHPRRHGQRDGRRARAVVRQRQLDRGDAVQVEHVLRSRRCRRAAARRSRRATTEKSVSVDLAQRRLAREELEAGFLGREARREARRAAGAVAGVGELLRREERRQAVGRRLAQQALDARDLDAVDAAAVGRPGPSVAAWPRRRRRSAPRASRSSAERSAAKAPAEEQPGEQGDGNCAARGSLFA